MKIASFELFPITNRA